MRVWLTILKNAKLIHEIEQVINNLLLDTQRSNEEKFYTCHALITDSEIENEIAKSLNELNDQI